MSTHNNHPPVETHRDGAVSAKVWRNLNKDGKPFYSVTFQRTYTDPGTGNISESRSFQGTDVLKIPHLANDAYHTIGQMREWIKPSRSMVNCLCVTSSQPGTLWVSHNPRNNRMHRKVQVSLNNATPPWLHQPHRDRKATHRIKAQAMAAHQKDNRG